MRGRIEAFRNNIHNLPFYFPPLEIKEEVYIQQEFSNSILTLNSHTEVQI